MIVTMGVDKQVSVRLVWYEGVIYAQAALPGTEEWEALDVSTIPIHSYLSLVRDYHDHDRTVIAGHSRAMLMDGE